MTDTPTTEPQPTADGQERYMIGGRIPRASELNAAIAAAEARGRREAIEQLRAEAKEPRSHRVISTGWHRAESSYHLAADFLESTGGPE